MRFKGLLWLFIFAKPAVEMLDHGCRQRQIDILVPMMAAFVILELSSAPREKRAICRMPFLLMEALQIFGAVVVYSGMVAVVLFNIAHPGSGHG